MIHLIICSLIVIIGIRLESLTSTLKLLFFLFILEDYTSSASFCRVLRYELSTVSSSSSTSTPVGFPGFEWQAFFIIIRILKAFKGTLAPSSWFTAIILSLVISVATSFILQDVFYIIIRIWVFSLIIIPLFVIVFWILLVLITTEILMNFLGLPSKLLRVKLCTVCLKEV